MYHAAASVIPQPLLAAQPDDEECIRGLSEIALSALGIATADDTADYFRLPAASLLSCPPWTTPSP